MKQSKTIVIIGGGYAGINLIDSLKKEKIDQDYRILLIDKQPYHFRKVKLFKAIVEENYTELLVPFEKYCTNGIEFLQGEVKAIQHEDKRIVVAGKEGQISEINYHLLVLAVGSVIIEADQSLGGITLSSLANAKKIREDLLNEISSSQSKLRISIIGGGITGIETSAEIATWVNKGLKAPRAEVVLINHQARLLPYLPKKVGSQIEKRLNKLGVTILHKVKVNHVEKNKIAAHDGSEILSHYSIWTVGLKPHPCLQHLGLPLKNNGKIIVDSWYRIKGYKNMYAIGDCAHIMDAKTGVIAAMTCKEAAVEAKSLAKVMKADLNGDESEGHKDFQSLYCIGLGPTDGLVWAQKWGIDFVLSGKIGVKMREFTWNLASLID